MNKSMIFFLCSVTFLVVVLFSTRDKTDYHYTSLDDAIQVQVEKYGKPISQGKSPRDRNIYFVTWQKGDRYIMVEFLDRDKDDHIDGKYGWYNTPAQ